MKDALLLTRFRNLPSVFIFIIFFSITVIMLSLLKITDTKLLEAVSTAYLAVISLMATLLIKKQLSTWIRVMWEHIKSNPVSSSRTLALLVLMAYFLINHGGKNLGANEELKSLQNFMDGAAFFLCSYYLIKIYIIVLKSKYKGQNENVSKEVNPQIIGLIHTAVKKVFVCSAMIWIVGNYGSVIVDGFITAPKDAISITGGIIFLWFIYTISPDRQVIYPIHGERSSTAGIPKPKDSTQVKIDIM